MNKVVISNISEILKTVVKKDLQNFEIIFHNPNIKGMGFLGEIIFITLKNKVSDTVFDLVVKQAFRDKSVRDMHPIRQTFLNEIYFYTRVWPEFDKFQQRIPPMYQFRKISKCFATDSKHNTEKIVLENFKLQGFELNDKKKTLNKEQFAFILKEYGKFHGLSFALKDLCPEIYSDVAKGLADNLSEFAKKDYFMKGIMRTLEDSLEGLQKGTDDAVIKKYKEFVQNGRQIYLDSIASKNEHSVILHGDCWSNNIMFKYSESRKLIDIRFLDFQLSKEGSPCRDLTYFVYSGASKEILANLDVYLQLYHDSLSETLTQFGCDSKKLYPFHILKEEWKGCCKFGFTTALMIWKMKFTHDDDLKDLVDITNISQENLRASNYDKSKFGAVSRNLILHFYSNDFL